jgi:hypothetical protein
MTADNASLQDVLDTPRSNLSDMSIPVDTVLELLDGFSRG